MHEVKGQNSGNLQRGELLELWEGLVGEYGDLVVAEVSVGEEMIITYINDNV